LLAVSVCFYLCIMSKQLEELQKKIDSKIEAFKKKHPGIKPNVILLPHVHYVAIAGKLASIDGKTKRSVRYVYKDLKLVSDGSLSPGEMEVGFVASYAT